MSNKFTRYDQEMLEIFRDPAKWAAHHLGEAPRWYQEEILRHPHHRKVLRCGRRIGKCIEETQRVLDPQTGAYKSVKELFETQKSLEEVRLVTLNEKYKLEESNAFFVEDNGVKPTFMVRTKYGAEVNLTGNHPVLTLDGWVEVDALKVGDRIATPYALPYFGESKMDVNKLKVVAYLLAGGNRNGSRVTFSCKSPEAMKDFRSAAEAIGIKTVKQVGKENTCLVITDFEDLDLQQVLSKEVPASIFKLEQRLVIEFLQVLYSVNGWVYDGSRPEIGYATSSKSLAKDIKHLLLRFGISANLMVKKKNYKGHITEHYQLMIHRTDSILQFTHLLGNVVGKEAELSELHDSVADGKVFEHTVPKEVWKHIEEERKAKRMSKAQVAGGEDERLRTNVAPTRSKIRTYADNLQSAFLYDLGRSDLIWEEVTDIISLGDRQTYDVFVPETHNLVVEDVMVHNTWTMTAHMLWVAFTCNGGTELKKGATCLVATPYDTQAREIFDQLNNFINNNPVLEASVASIRRSPYEIVFHNKSRIKLYTAGTRSGSEGGSLRGQKASWLYMDEVDYLGDKDFEAIYAITLEAPDRIGVMVASTPTGRRGKFYQICHEKMNQDVELYENHTYNLDTYDRFTAEGWAEFYFPTMVNPEWSPKMERELRSIYTEVGYEHEVLAEFGTEMVGVFNKDYVDEAASIPYNVLERPMHDGPIAIGIDWDKYGAATQIVVVQWEPNEVRRARPDLTDEMQFGRFRVIKRIEIPKGEFTYDNAVKKIIEIDKIYNPFAIYPDRGAGEYQIEMLRKHLGDKVKGVHLGSSHLVRDPHSREYDKKPIKPFMVSQTTMILERGMLRIPNKEVDEVIVRQMTNYTIERVSPKTGEPTYSSDDEHALDAMMMALLAFIIEKPDIANTIMEVKAARKMGHANVKFVDPLKAIHNVYSNTQKDVQEYIERWDEPGAPPPRRTNLGKGRRSAGFGWGSRGTGGRGGPPKRSSW